MKIQELKVNYKYHINYPTQDETAYVGEGILLGFNPSGYPEGTLEFYLPKDKQLGYFSAEDVEICTGSCMMENLNEEELTILFDAVNKGIITKNLAVKSILERVDIMRARYNG